MSDWILAAPLWLTVLIAVIGVGVFLSGLRRTRPGLRIAGTAICALVAVLFILNQTVDTDQKKIARATQSLLDAVAQQKWSNVSAILEPQAILSMPQSAPLCSNADQIVADAQLATQKWPPGNITIVSQSLMQNSSTEFTETMTLSSTSEAFGGQRVPSSWQLDWVKDGSAWRVKEIHPIQIANQSGSDMLSIFTHS